MISLLIIYAVGIVDDIVGVQAKIKFMFQIIAASLLPNLRPIYQQSIRILRHL